MLELIPPLLDEAPISKGGGINSKKIPAAFGGRNPPKSTGGTPLISQILELIPPLIIRDPEIEGGVLLLKRLLILLSPKIPSFCGFVLSIVVGIARSEGAPETKMTVLSNDCTVSHIF